MRYFLSHGTCVFTSHTVSGGTYKILVWHYIVCMTYKDSEEVRVNVRKCAALVFLRSEDVEDSWQYIHGQAPGEEKLNELFNYFVERRLENPS